MITYVFVVDITCNTDNACIENHQVAADEGMSPAGSESQDSLQSQVALLTSPAKASPAKASPHAAGSPLTTAVALVAGQCKSVTNPLDELDRLERLAGKQGNHTPVADSGAIDPPVPKAKAKANGKSPAVGKSKGKAKQAAKAKAKAAGAAAAAEPTTMKRPAAAIVAVGKPYKIVVSDRKPGELGCSRCRGCPTGCLNCTVPGFSGKLHTRVYY